MSNVVTIGRDGADIPDGTHPAIFRGSRVEHSAQYDSDFRIWEFAIAGPGNTTADISGSSSTGMGPRSKGYRWLCAILGRKPAEGEAIDLDTLVNTPVLISTVTNEAGWPKVDAVLPAVAAVQPAPTLVAQPGTTNVEALP